MVHQVAVLEENNREYRRRNASGEWDLLAIGIAFVVVKLALMTWYYLTA